ncbi:MAG TPA: ABC transporter permease [Pilimelia sp.]|nr:ABC transporter permease [Pilimelia sp.]
MTGGTRVLGVKLVRDLRAAWSRLALMVVAIAVSLTVFGAVLLAWSAIGRETDGAYLGTAPASATILLDRPVDADRMATIAARARSRPGVLEATGRTQFTSEVSVNGRSRGTPLQVFAAAPDDPMRLATFEPARGGWPPARDEILIRRDALALLAVAVGDTVTVRAPGTAQAPGGVSLRLRVADTVYDPSLAPSPQQQTGAGYISTAALAGAGGRADLDQLKIQVAASGEGAPSRDRDSVVAVARQVGEWLRREEGVAVREIQVPPPYAHPHQWQADALLLSLLGGGAAALLLSTILVATMLNGLFTRQIPQIGIMKAIGARSGHIGRLYAAMTLLVAAVATLLALGPAILLGRAAVAAFTGFLGIRPDSVAAPWWTYAVFLAAGLGLPPLVALAPLVRAARTTVRAAIDHHGLGANPHPATGVLARLGRRRRLNRGMDRGLVMAARNTIRRPARFLLAVGLLACAGMVFVAGMSLNAGTQAIDDERREQRNWDVDVQLASPGPAARVARVVAAVPGVSRVEGFHRALTGVAGPGQVPITRTYPDQGHGSVSVLTVPAATTMLPRPEVIEGRWLRPGETGAVVLNQISRDNTVPGIHAGDDVQLIVGGTPTTWRVVGLVQEREGGSGGTYVTAAGFAAAMGQPERVNLLRIATDGHDERTRVAVAGAVDEALADAGIEVLSAASVSRGDAVSAGHLGPVLLILLGVAIPLGVIGTIGLASTMSANVLDRTREFGVMHAIGAAPKAVRRIVVAEGVLIALASCVLAAAPTVGLTWLLGAGLGDLFMSAPLPFRISLLAAGIWIALVVLGAVLATEAAASRAARLTVREAIAHL